jgi:hypothetical protein
MTDVKNIVLVHGGFVDGSGWRGVYDHLTADGYKVTVVQNPTLSLASDVDDPGDCPRAFSPRPGHTTRSAEVRPVRTWR